MRLLLLVLMLPMLAVADGPLYLYSRSAKTAKIVATGGAPIPISFNAADPQSKVLADLSSYGHILIFNGCTGTIAVNANYTAQPTDNNTGNIYVNASTGLVLDNIPVGSSVFIRSDSGAPLSGCTVLVTVW
jgi:hypothetical protein